MGYLTTYRLKIYHNYVYYDEDKEVVQDREKELKDSGIFPDLIIGKIMGYYKKEKVNDQLFREILQAFEDFLGEGELFDERGITDECKWYDHQEDLVKFSKKYPKILFKLNGDGEDREDYWVLYVINGSYFKERAEIIIQYPKFDLTKMHNPEYYSAQFAKIKKKVPSKITIKIADE